MGNYEPKLLIAGYADGNNWYLESHGIGRNGEVLAGKPLQEDTIKTIAESLYKQHQQGQPMTGIIPERLLYADTRTSDYRLIWWSAAQQRTLYFGDIINLPSSVAWVPPMVYVARKNELVVFALASDARPTEETELYLAPFYNTNDAGGVCLGNAETNRKGNDYEDYMTYWETIFWNSIFTHGTSHTKTPMNLLWQRLMEDTTLQWKDLDELIPAKKTIAKLIER